jgi:hypothetical protein
MVWLVRAISAVALTVSVYLSATLAARGDTLSAVLFLSISIAYVLATWMNPLSPLLWIGIAAMISALLVLDPGVVSVTLAIAAAVLFWMRGRKQSSPVDPATLRPVEPDSVMPSAQAFVTELIEAGWRQAGAYAFDSRKTAVTVSVLVHPDLDRHAEITDMVFSIESRFPNSRILITNSSGRAVLPPSYLTNDVFGATPAELAEAHQHALDILGGFDLEPEHVLEHTIVSEAMASEMETIEWSYENPSGGLFNFGGGHGALDDSPASKARIEEWRRATIEYSVPGGE